MPPLSLTLSHHPSPVPNPLSPYLTISPLSYRLQQLGGLQHSRAGLHGSGDSRELLLRPVHHHRTRGQGHPRHTPAVHPSPCVLQRAHGRGDSIYQGVYSARDIVILLLSFIIVIVMMTKPLIFGLKYFITEIINYRLTI